MKIFEEKMQDMLDCFEEYGEELEENIKKSKEVADNILRLLKKAFEDASAGDV